MLRIAFAAVVVATLGGAVMAQDSQPVSEVQRAWDAATKAATAGPADVAFRDNAVMHLPDTYAFFPKNEGAAFMRAVGNSTDDRFVGMIVPKSPDQYWFITVDYNDTGHVNDEDAKTWNADDLMQSIKTGTEEDNKRRVAENIPALDVLGWVEKPAYDSGTHRLVWSILAKERGAAQDAESVINYNTYALGREGYFELNLVTGEKTISADRRHAAKLLAALNYKDGQRYEDFNSSTDHLAEFGLAALVGGVAAKKLGLLAIFGVVLVKFWKLALIALAVAAGVARKFFKRKDASP